MSEEMKPSHVKWIGEIPQSWSTNKIGQIYKQRNQKVSDENFEPLSVTKQGILPQLENAAKSDDHSNRKLVRKSDFVINSRSDRKMSSGTSPLDGSVSLINTVLYSDKVLPEFSNYLLKNYGFAEEFYRWGTGIVADLWSTNFQRMKSIWIPVPPLEEQKKIADFLDEKVKQINYLIQSTEDSIIEIKNNRQSKMNELVNAHGHDLEVSDNIWVGKVPSDWRVNRLKEFVKLYSKKTNYKNGEAFIALENVESKTGEILNLSTDIDSGMSSFAEKGMVAFNKLRPYLAKAIVVPEDINLTGEFLVLVPNEKLNNEYLKYKLLSTQFIDAVNSSSYGAKMPRSNWEFISNVGISVPPISEQVEIVKEVDKLFDDSKKIIELKLNFIRELISYKQSLIYEYTTGKKRVN